MKDELKPQRILCRCGCGEYLKPNFVREKIPHKNPTLQAVGFTQEGKVLEITGYGYNDNGIFNTLRCGFRWAVKNAKR